MAFPAFLDTCVLCPAYLCDTLLRLTGTVRVPAVVVTLNVRDLPETALKPYDIDALHPDDLLLDQLDLHPGATIQALRDQAAAYRREQPPSQDCWAVSSAVGFKGSQRKCGVICRRSTPSPQSGQLTAPVGSWSRSDHNSLERLPADRGRNAGPGPH
jgi:hypothetical protein